MKRTMGTIGSISDAVSLEWPQLEPLAHVHLVEAGGVEEGVLLHAALHQLHDEA